jgi:alkyl hydroperoxide reductase subunit AhpC
VAQLRRQRRWFAEHDTNVVVVTFEQPWRAAAYAREAGISWPILLDADRSLYTAYEMHRASRRKVLGVKNWWAYIRLILRGYKVQRPTDDIYQLGGDVLVDPQGIVRMHFVSESPVDRPAVASIQRMIENKP